MAEPEADASPESYYYGYYGGYPYHRGYWGGYRGYYGYPYRYWKRDAEAAPTAPAADADASPESYYYGYYGHPYRYGGYYGGYYGLGYRGYYGYPYRYWKREAAPAEEANHTIKKRSADAEADASPESYYYGYYGHPYRWGGYYGHGYYGHRYGYGYGYWG